MSGSSPTAPADTRPARSRVCARAATTACSSPRQRHLGLAALDPALTLPGGAVVRLAVHEWASGALDPAGHHHLERFELADGVPRWRWRIGEVVLEREIAMTHGRNSVAVVHRLVAAPAGRRSTLSLTALCTWRHADAERDRTGPAPEIAAMSGGFTVDDAYRVDGPDFRPLGEWYLDAYAREEAARGLNPVEDLWAAGTFAGHAHRRRDPVGVGLVAGRLRGQRAARSGGRRRRRAPGPEAAADRGHRGCPRRRGRDPGAGRRRVHRRPPTGPDVVAGYPWFGSLVCATR